ncbi:Chondroitin proteoglycan 3 [Toxocara canis]|uniref:Chondroitin proteoglycan 3 n=1 Tax=Toxocara canis TaxID=6265 RepID=A0A0B2V1W5_TOXCA|nr:Chondroitin proteoglycan 3 [Toxocara canis]
MPPLVFFIIKSSNYVPDSGSCLGIAVGKCNCGACISLLSCEDDSACGGLIGACNNETSLCDCELENREWKSRRKDKPGNKGEQTKSLGTYTHSAVTWQAEARVRVGHTFSHIANVHQRIENRADAMCLET